MIIFVDLHYKIIYRNLEIVFFSFMFCILVTEGESFARIHIYKMTNVKHSQHYHSVAAAGPAADKRVLRDQVLTRM